VGGRPAWCCSPAQHQCWATRAARGARSPRRLAHALPSQERHAGESFWHRARRGGHAPARAGHPHRELPVAAGHRSSHRAGAARRSGAANGRAQPRRARHHPHRVHSAESGATPSVAPNRAGVSNDALDKYALHCLPSTEWRRDAETGFYVDGKRAIRDRAHQRFDPGDATWLSVVPKSEPLSARRAIGCEDPRRRCAFDKLVGAPPRSSWTSVGSLRTSASGLAIVAVVTFVLLFMMTGSLLVPAKQSCSTSQSTATSGAVVWVPGRPSRPCSTSRRQGDRLVHADPMFCIAFGLSMDYEVSCLSRIKEEYDLSTTRGPPSPSGSSTPAGSSPRRSLLPWSSCPRDVAGVSGEALRSRAHARRSRGRVPDPRHPRSGVMRWRPANWWAPRPLRRSSAVGHLGVRAHWPSRLECRLRPRRDRMTRETTWRRNSQRSIVRELYET